MGSEASNAVKETFCGLSGAGALYAVYWQILNPASGKILRRLGFVSAGKRNILNEYDAVRAMSFHNFELWRLRETEEAVLLDVAKEAAT